MTALSSHNSPVLAVCHRLTVAIAAGFRAVTAKENPMTRLFARLTIAALLSAAVPAYAMVPLNQNEHITESLVAAKVGDTIRKTCPSITARMFTVLGKMNDLEDYARAQGYTEAEVKAFLKDKTEKARINGLAADYLKNAGAVEGDAESYCVAGKAEIANGTLAGSLLKSWK
jgi:hypothetical protein